MYKLTDEQALVATVDYFTPIVDDPFTYGRIAAVNSLSDVYAMGGKPFLALNVAGFPTAEQPEEILAAILQGGAETCRLEGVLLGGGHTIRAPEIFFGLVALGFVHPDRILKNANARPGDALVLTKALGTGVISTALKAGDCPPGPARAAEESMLRSNGPAAALMYEWGAAAATDVTGFGLLGHGLEMARASGVALRIWAKRVPELPEALAFAGNYIPGGLTQNLQFVSPSIRKAAAVGPELLNLLADPQTSGGLLVALPPAQAEGFAAAAGAPAAIVGEVLAAGEPYIEITES